MFIELGNLLANPNPDDPLDTAIAEIYKTDIEKFKKTANEWVKKFCR